MCYLLLTYFSRILILGVLGLVAGSSLHKVVALSVSAVKLLPANPQAALMDLAPYHSNFWDYTSPFHWAKSRDSYHRIASESYRYDSIKEAAPP